MNTAKLPVINYSITDGKWHIHGEPSGLSVGDLNEKYGIYNPVIYCQEQYKRLKKTPYPQA